MHYAPNNIHKQWTSIQQRLIQNIFGSLFAEFIIYFMPFDVSESQTVSNLTIPANNGCFVLTLDLLFKITLVIIMFDYMTT